jgi:uncharacterized membrane protein YbhN (UPF0104 family)
MNKWLKYLVYISIVFLLWTLWREDYLYLPEVENYFFLSLSIVFLFAGYITKSKVWQVGLQVKGTNASLRDSIASTGLAELSKYIPGKLWIIIGRAGYIAGRYAIGSGKAAGISLIVQFLTIWSGIFVALIGIIFIHVPLEWILLLGAGWLALTFILFLKPFHDLLQKGTQKILKKEVSLPFISFKESKPVLHWFFIDWLVRMIGFYLMLVSMSTQTLSPALAAGFPLSITLGIMVIFAPGGIGVREGILVVWLTTAGFHSAEATTLSIATRLWTLLGEIGIFATGMIIKAKDRHSWTK